MTDERTFEEIRDALDLWMSEPSRLREVKIRRTALGFVCVLFDGPTAVAAGRGSSSDSATEDALDRLNRFRCLQRSQPTTAA